MKRTLLSSAALTVLGTAALAGGIERSNQSALVLYKDGNYVEISMAKVQPNVTGKDYAEFGSNDIDNVAQSYTMPQFAAKMELTDQWSVALMTDNAFGAHTEYGGDAATTAFGGTTAEATAKNLTFLAKYQFNENFSAFGGIRRQTAEGAISLRGLAYTREPASPTVLFFVPDAQREGFTYDVDLESGAANGVVLGAAYEIPDIALRVALTYNSEITHKLATKETYSSIAVRPNAIIAPLQTQTEDSTTEVKTPKSWNLEFQSGVAADTLVFGSVRWVEHSVFRLDPKLFEEQRDTGLISFEDSITYTLGVGRRFNENFAAQISLTKETVEDDMASPLGPTAGKTGLSIGGAYKFDNGFELSGGVNYTWLGDAKAQTGDIARADFDDNTAMAAGIKLAYTF